MARATRLGPSKDWTKREWEAYRRGIAAGKRLARDELLAPSRQGPLLRLSEVLKLTGLSRATIWRLVEDGAFPTRVQITANRVGWYDGEVQAWMRSRRRRPITKMTFVGLPKNGGE